MQYAGLSFWHCEFISEVQVNFSKILSLRFVVMALCFWRIFQLEVHQPHMHTSFIRRFGADEPPLPLDTASRKHRNQDGDGLDLFERYYKWGIRPEWLTIHRIIGHE